MRSISVVAVNWQKRMKLGSGMKVTTTLFTTESCEPMAQYTRMMPRTRVDFHRYVAALLLSSFVTPIPSTLALPSLMFAYGVGTAFALRRCPDGS